MNFEEFVPYINTVAQSVTSLLFAVKLLSQVGSLWMIVSIVCKIHDSYILSKMNSSLYDVADYMETIKDGFKL